jgi:hypothetical protein
MSIEDYLYRAKAALLVLGNLACFMDKDSTPAEEFGFGLSVILGYIEDDVTAAYNEYMKPKEKTE